MKFQFSNVVVVDDNKIGVIVKSWADKTYDVYVRYDNNIGVYKESEIKHFVYSKYLSDEEIGFYK